MARTKNPRYRWRIGGVPRSELAKLDGVKRIRKVRRGVFEIEGESWLDPTFALPEFLGVRSGIVCDHRRGECTVLDPEWDDGWRPPTRAEMAALLG